MLAEKKVGIGQDGKQCKAIDACPKATVFETMKLFDKAVVGGRYRERVAMYRGLLTLNYPLSLSEEEAVSKAYSDFCLAYQGWGIVPVIISLVDTGLRLYTIRPEQKEKIRDDLEKALQKFTVLFPKFKDSAAGERHADAWTPSVYIFEETCEQVYSIKKNYSCAIETLSLGELVDQAIQCVRKCQSEIGNHER